VRRALVTGAARGIGAAIAERLRADGLEVTTLDRAEGCDLQVDLTGDELPDLGEIDVCVSNAAITDTIAPAHRMTPEQWSRDIDVNLTGAFRAVQACLPGMRERGYGRILFTSSVAGLTGGIVGPHYASSKAGLHGLTHFLASRVAADGVTVNAIAPALIEDTGMLPGDPAELTKAVPVGRLGKPAEVADLALAMLRNGYLTSKVVMLDGGIHPR
jgi:NAD(P)-dependent dehydrogenase (short-subunit alcohol dehydrogenase family)